MRLQVLIQWVMNSLGPLQRKKNSCLLSKSEIENVPCAVLNALTVIVNGMSGSEVLIAPLAIL